MGRGQSPAEIIDFSGYVAERTSDFTGREWVFEEITSWLEKQDGPRFFVLTGEPGSGKTAIAGRLHDFGRGVVAPPKRAAQLKEGFLGASHFCSAKDLRWVDPFQFANSLATQLANRYPAFLTILNAQASERRESSDRGSRTYNIVQNVGTAAGGRVTGAVITINASSPERAFGLAVREPLEALFRGEFDEQVVILVDSLDEALLSDEQANIVSLLTRTERLPAGVRFIVTSRPEVEALRALSRAGAEECLLGSASGMEASRTDVHRHVLDVAAARPALTAKLAGALTVANLADAIKVKSEGNFLYVRYLLEMLEQQDERVTKQSLETLPAGLDGIYLEFLERLVGDGGEAWHDRYAPVIGTLAVAQEALNEQQLATLAGITRPQARQALTTLRQFLDADDAIPASVRPYAIYHRSFGDFLLDADRAAEFWRDAAEQHQRIVDHCRAGAASWELVDWTACDPYALRNVVHHLHALLKLASSPKEEEARANDLYAVVLDETFQRIRHERLGDPGFGLRDLRLALETALARDDLIQVLACAGAYRRTIRAERITESVFRAVDEGDVELALTRAQAYVSASDWVRALRLYLAWEAAEAGDGAIAQQAVNAAHDAPRGRLDDLCDALLARIARTLDRQSDSRAAAAWLRDTAPWRDADALLAAYDEAGPLNPEALALRARELAERQLELQRLAEEGSAELASVVPFLEADLREEAVAEGASSVRRLLVELAADPSGRQGIDDALNLVLTNPYPRYRDIALAALAIATLAVPDDASWVRDRLRRIIGTALDDEGVTFTFDLAFVLRAAAEQRGLPAAALASYLDQGLNTYDVWGTAVRARSAEAAGLVRRGDDFLPALDHAGNIYAGYAGYATMAVLAVINRWWEIGMPSHAPLWVLWGRAMSHAASVRAPDFREERIELVNAYRGWAKADTPETGAALTALAAMADHDTRMAYVDHLAARWSWPSDAPNGEGLRTLVPLALGDGTTLDSVLGRLIGSRVKQLSDEELTEAARICAEELTTGRPWEFRQWH